MSARLITARRGLRWLLVVATLWLLLLFALMIWWGWVVHRQAVRIEELQQVAGQSSSAAHAQWQVTQRMLAWEGGTLVVLLTGLSVSLIWLYLRDQRRTRASQAFFASVTHELRTPLTSIRLQAESLADAGPASPLIRRLLEDTSRLEAQVEKTLELARLEGGGTLDLQPLPIRAWLEHQVQGVKAEGSALEVDLQRARQPADELVLADRNALKVIVRNLVENTLRHAQAMPARARIAIASEPTTVTVSFADQGHGFSGDAARLGTLFYRGERSQGAGVGLYLIRTLMRQMGGDATYSSQPGAGFETRLVFRRAEEPA
jgi:signal transduction histidine kinase